MEFYYRDTDKDILILRADGGLDSHNAQTFLNELQQLIEAGARRLVVDCVSLGYISSFGITTLIRIHKRLSEAGGNVKLAAVQAPLFRLLEITRLNEVFHAYPSVEEALKAFHAEEQTSER
jgi:stage II sporulation protein AA (anti-sigma F factor antagonist)